MYISAIFGIICVFHIYSVRSGLILKKLKLSQVSTVQNYACPPGVWTSSTAKRSEIDEGPWESPDATLFNKNTVTEETSHLEYSKAPKDCPPGMWVYKKKRMLKQMLKTALKKSNQDGRVTN